MQPELSPAKLCLTDRYATSGKKKHIRNTADQKLKRDDFAFFSFENRRLKGIDFFDKRHITRCHMYVLQIDAHVELQS